jgi:Cys-tRNA(Pro) deacylase
MAQFPVTQAIRVLRKAAVAYEPFLYPWQPHGGTQASAKALKVDEHFVVKSLIFEDQDGAPLCVLMHGDREVSTKQLARVIKAKTVAPCSPDVANRHSGYQVGGTSPFGLRHSMPVYIEQTILQLPHIYINGGSRGFLVRLDPKDAQRILQGILVEVAI